MAFQTAYLIYAVRNAFSFLNTPRQTKRTCLTLHKYCQQFRQKAAVCFIIPFHP
ncbi:predicted protein [Neisseria gonorrhoeae SK-93-1035]|nr:predicted protein [Neisseria gonorrhoeae SK-93-1035]